MGAGLENLYLDTRYACTALQQKLRGTPVYRELGEALQSLCRELRGLLRDRGVDRVSRPFPRELLDKPVEELLHKCRGAAEALASRGSMAAGRILSILDSLNAVSGRRA